MFWALSVIESRLWHDAYEKTLDVMFIEQRWVNKELYSVSACSLEQRVF